MAIHELVPKHEIGWIKWGKKIGKEIVLNGSATIEHIHEAQGPLPNAHMQEITSDMGVIVTGPNSIKPVFYVEDFSYGFVHSEGKELVGKQINEHPLIKKKIRWVEGTIS